MESQEKQFFRPVGFKSLVDFSAIDFLGSEKRSRDIENETVVKQPNIVEKALGKAFEIDKQERETSVKRGDTAVTLRGGELKDLAGTLFAEAQNFDDDEEQKAEIRSIANVALNRAAKDGSLSKTLARRTQGGMYEFNGRGSDQYRLYMGGTENPLEKRKIDLVHQVIEEIYGGDFEDNTGGATFFSHDDNGVFTPDLSRQY